MRRTSQNCEVIEDNGVIIGINLGYDFAAEHEWGFKWAMHLGRPERVTPELCGVAGRTTTKVSDRFNIELVEHDGELWMRGRVQYRSNGDDGLIGELTSKSQSGYTRDMVSNIRKSELRAGWNTDSGFVVVGSSDRAKEAIRLVHKALIENSCFMIQSSGIFGAGGLKLFDARLIDSEIDTKLTEQDRSNFSLAEAVDATGIKERLQTAGKRYFALSPRWDKDNSIMFWLNPMEQQKNNFGWFTVQDLDDWIAGKGKIPMEAT